MQINEKTKLKDTHHLSSCTGIEMMNVLIKIVVIKDDTALMVGGWMSRKVELVDVYIVAEPTDLLDDLGVLRVLNISEL